MMILYCFRKSIMNVMNGDEEREMGEEEERKQRQANLSTTTKKKKEYSLKSQVIRRLCGIFLYFFYHYYYFSCYSWIKSTTTNHKFFFFFFLIEFSNKNDPKNYLDRFFFFLFGPTKHTIPSLYTHVRKKIFLGEKNVHYTQNTHTHVTEAASRKTSKGKKKAKIK